MALLRYQGDVRKAIPRVLGGRFKVVDKVYDETKDVTLVEVQPLVDPLVALDREMEK